MLSASAHDWVAPKATVVTLPDIIGLLQTTWAGVSPLEVVAACLGLAYVVLAIRESPWCWAFAFVSTALYLRVFAEAHLYMQSALQAYFLSVAVYGWFAWRRTDTERAPTNGSWRMNLWALGAMTLVAALTAHWLSAETHSADPLIDAWTTWASVYATGLQAKKRRENWLWWIAIDCVIAWLCLRQGLPLTAILYVLYVGLAALGWRSWATNPAK
jgi:nicotinamide mononucleotide transporter